MRELRKLSDLTGYSFQATDGDIGSLKEVYFDDFGRSVTSWYGLATGCWVGTFYSCPRLLTVLMMKRKLSKLA